MTAKTATPSRAPRKTWVRPRVHRLGAGAAEFGVATNLDAEGFS
jgi:hypothetical protein